MKNNRTMNIKDIIYAICNRNSFSTTFGVDRHNKPLRLEGICVGNTFEIWHDDSKVMVLPLDSNKVTFYRKTPAHKALALFIPSIDIEIPAGKWLSDGSYGLQLAIT